MTDPLAGTVQSPPSSLRRPSRHSQPPRTAAPAILERHTERRCSVRRPDDTSPLHDLSTRLCSKSIHGIHPRLSLPPFAVNRAVFPLGHRSRDPPSFVLHNTELGGKTLLCLFAVRSTPFLLWDGWKTIIGGVEWKEGSGERIVRHTRGNFVHVVLDRYQSYA